MKVGTGFTDGTVQFYDNSMDIANYAGASHCSTEQCLGFKPKEPPYVFRKGNSSLLIIASSSVRESVHTPGAADCGSVSPAGFLRMQAFYYSLQHIEKLVGFTFNTAFIDFCYSDQRAYSLLEQLFQPEFLTIEDDAGKIINFTYDSIVAAVGDNSSGISVILQGFLKLFSIPQLSYSSTSASLSDHFLFPTFIRNVPSDSEQGVSMVQIAKRIGIQNIGVIHSDTLYGMPGGEKVKQTVHQERDMCISFEATISANNREKDIKSAVEYLVSPEHKTMAFLIFCEDYIIEDILNGLERSALKYTWTEHGRFFIASETWGRKPHLIENRNDVTRGSITFDFDQDSFQWTVNGETNHFKDFLSALTTANHQNDHLFLMSWQDNFNCSVKGKYDTVRKSSCSSECNLVSSSAGCTGRWTFDFEEVYAKRMVMAVYSIGYAIYDALTEGKCSSKYCENIFTNTSKIEFRDRLLRTEIPDQVVTAVDPNPSRNMSPFDGKGDGRANYEVSNIDVKAPEYELIYEVFEGEVSLREGRQPTYFPGGQEALMTQILHLKCPQNVEVTISSQQEQLPSFSNLSDLENIKKALDYSTANFWISTVTLVILLVFTPAVGHYAYYTMLPGEATYDKL